MCTWKQGSFLPCIHPYSRGNQTRQEQIKIYQRSQTTHSPQNQLWCFHGQTDSMHYSQIQPQAWQTHLGAILTQVDNDSKFYVIPFAPRQLKDHEKNYSPFLLEAATAVWGMDNFNESLWGKQLILYTNHKLLEKLGHLHNKTLNRLQLALLGHDFVIQYKKGSNMPADYLFRLPG
jgi:hypothetical protein